MKHDRRLTRTETSAFDALLEKTKRLCAASQDLRLSSEEVIFNTQDLIEAVASKRQDKG